MGAANVLNQKRTWQLISIALAAALLATLVELHRSRTYRPATGMVPNVSGTTNLEHLALSPNARRAHERYSL